jgi:hypothetical protein
MNTNFSDGEYIIFKKGNNITAMGFNISKVTNKTGSIVPAGLLSQLIKNHDKDKEDVDAGDIDLLEKNVDESDENVVSDDLWENLLKLASKVEKGKKKEMMKKQEPESEKEPKKKKRRTKKKALSSKKRTTRRSKSK